MLTIRLQRTGKRNQADFRIVLAEKEAPVNKKVVEILGSYNPRKKTFQVKEERVKYWIDQRVEMSPTVHNLFATKGLHSQAKVKAFNTPKKPAEKSEESEKSEKSETTTVETPAEVTEATAEVEAKVEGTAEASTEKSE